MIGFGFTIVEAFSGLAQMKDLAPARMPEAPTYLGLALIGTGVIALAIALWLYVLAIHHLDEPQCQPIADRRRGTRSPAWIVALALLATDVLAFASVLVRALL